MTTEKCNNDYYDESCLKLQRQFVESCRVEAMPYESILAVDELFQFYKKHFNELRHTQNLPPLLVFTHRCLEPWIRGGGYLKDDIGIHLFHLLREHKEYENDINIVIQIVYQVLNSIKYFGCSDILMSEKLLREIIAIIPIIESRTITSNCIACFQKYMEIFPGSKKNLEPLWSFLKFQLQSNLGNGFIKDIQIDILMQLIDDFKSIKSDFYDEPVLISTIQHLLKSDQRKNRKYGYYLLKKLFHFSMENITNDPKCGHHGARIEQSWVLYITMLENLEEEQSHLILPSLENLEELITKKQLPSSWLDILYIRILTHNNNVVLRWSIEFFLKTFSSCNLSREVLKHFLQATNSNSLFNVEGYFLKNESISSFLRGDVKCLIKSIPEVDNWKSLPLYIWLENLKKAQLLTLLTFEDVLKTSSCVRKLQNCLLRREAIKVCQELFADLKRTMSMQEYITYVETLYNSGDKYLEHEIFFTKKSSIVECKAVGSIFNQRFYEIFTNSEWNNNTLISFLKDIPAEQHGWLKYAPFKLKIEKRDRNFINNLYKLDLDSVASCTINEVVEMFKNSLLGSPPNDKHELIECKQAAISFYIYERDFEIEKESTLGFIINNRINHSEVLVTFAEKLLDKTDKEIDLHFVDELIKYNDERVFNYIFRYLRTYYDDSVILKYAIILWKDYKFNAHKLNSCLVENINFIKLLTDEWLKRLASRGDERIEEAFCFYHFQPKNFVLEIKCSLVNDLTRQNKQFALDLLTYHSDITKKRPRYFENSNEHRIKLRIASYIYYITVCDTETAIDVLDQIWGILLNENNQLNIVYIYEHILGKKESRGNVILNKLKEALNLSPSQQVSIISVAYTYCQSRPTTKEMKNMIVYSLLSLTMGANFQTRLFAQVSLYQLLKSNFEQTEEWKQLIQCIEVAAGTKLSEYLKDIRLQINKSSKIVDAIKLIFFLTNVPFDELLHINNYCNEWHELSCELKYDPKRYMNNYKAKENESTTTSEKINDQLQRKMNPVNNLTEPHNLIAYPIEERSAEMFVVASLIDKLPNLGGIARTCEVMGIKNLVIDSKMHTEKNDFKNLSMTAEKTLNIFEVKPKDLKEFLTNKKLEGYNIVGAEQTCNSQSFNTFEFPKKCVLLLGHEKDGVPAPLLGLLDAAVEIPQLGQVRSLNVHVTGALFMWEYCKQHLIPK